MIPVNGRRRRALLVAWLPAAIGVLVICVESTDLCSSAHTSQLLRPLWQAIFGAVSNGRWEADNYFLRKTGHFVGYGILSLLFYRGWRRSGYILDIRRPRIVDVVFAFACTLTIASADEYHQSFLPSRTSRPQDVFIDIAGAALFLLLFQLWLLFAGAIRRRPGSPRAVPHGR